MNGLSCIIPCYPPHKKFLNQCFEQIKKQSLLPNEVILAISETDQNEANRIKEEFSLLYKQINIDFKIINSTKQQFAGINRNMGASIANYEYITFVDCDDYLHPDKFLIAVKYMQKYDSDVLIHSFVWNKPPEFIDNLKIDIENILVIDSNKIYNDMFPSNYVRNRRRELIGKVPVFINSNDKNIIYHIHAGHITVKKNIFDVQSYTNKKRGQDCLFLRDCIFSKANVIYLYAELLNYIH